MDYVESLANLHTDTSPARWPATMRHRAPHKPFLFLAVMDLVAQGVIQTPFIEFTVDLLDMFDLYWSSTMAQGKRSTPALPFFHMRSEGFWHLVPVPGKEQVLDDVPQIRSISKLRQLVLGAVLDDGLFDMMLDGESRDDLRRVLIETYFTPEVWPILVELGQISTETFQYGLELQDRSRRRFRLRVKETGRGHYHQIARSTAFRRVIMGIYDFTCVMTQLRVMTPEGHSAVVAAHIVPWNESHNDDPRNGLALSPLCHWAFDQGLIGVNSDYRVLVSPAIPEEDKGAEPLLSLDGRELQLPAERARWPAKEALTWHRRHVFRSEAPTQLL